VEITDRAGKFQVTDIIGSGSKVTGVARRPFTAIPDRRESPRVQPATDLANQAVDGKGDGCAAIL
jgi:hypothetical protein